MIMPKPIALVGADEPSPEKALLRQMDAEHVSMFHGGRQSTPAPRARSTRACSLGARTRAVTTRRPPRPESCRPVQCS